MERAPHGVPGQVNVYVLDVDSEITSFGKHNRLLVSMSLDHRTVNISELLTGLTLSTEADRQRVSKGYQRLHRRGQRLDHISSVECHIHGRNYIEHTYGVK